MGVIAETDVDYGKIFGPFPAVGHIPQSHFIGYLTTDEMRDTGLLKINLNNSSLGNSWMPYVQPARTMDEQNMEAYLKNGNIYYRSLRIIRAGEQLLVWYSKDFSQILGIPDVNNAFRENDAELICRFCNEKFQYGFPLIAHMRFRCHKKSYPGSNEANPSSAPSGEDNRKRAINDDANDVHQRKVFVKSRDLSDEENNNITRTTVSEMAAIHSSPYSKTKSEDCGSAFKKVERHVVSAENNLSFSNVSQRLLMQEVGNVLRDGSNESLATVLSCLGKGPLYSLANNLTRGAGSPRWMSPVCQTYFDPRLHTACNTSLSSVRPATSVQRNDTVTSTVRNADLSEKQILVEKIRKSHVPLIQTVNPMLETILHTATPTLIQNPIQAMSLAQNWCANCNATFRMTSDLVFHMRSHHKREFDPVKKKREDKLQCNVCKETFKERHHLTRHMTSHT